MSSEQLATDLEAALAKPRSIMVDGQLVTSNSLPEQIEAQKVIAATRVVAKERRLIFNRIAPPGAS